MRYDALPGEVTRWVEQLQSLPEDRRARVIRMLAFVLADCPVCEGPVRRCDPRARAGDGFMHVRCRGTAS